MTRTGEGGGTTTISTIAIQSGGSRLVIALLQSGLGPAPALQLRVLEMTPEFGYLGNSPSEAATLQKNQEAVIAALQVRLSVRTSRGGQCRVQSKQNPVEELLRQADQMILTQQPRAEVYSAMAESLGTAWRDINKIMEERKIILDINNTFQGHLQVVSVQT